MASVLPHSAQIRADIAKYLTDAAALASKSSSRLNSSGNFRAIYKITLATDAVLSKLSPKLTPRLAVPRSIIQRVPVLIAVSQIPAAKVELRRFIEVAMWAVYFSDHPIEWATFESHPERGIQSDTDSPITYNAHREPAFYRNYAKERFSNEPSGLAKQAVADLGVQFSYLSAMAHGAALAARKRLLPPIEEVDEKNLSDVMTHQRRVCASVCIMLSAFCRQQFDGLPPAHRAWFDWLLGTKASSLRSKPFGL